MVSHQCSLWVGSCLTELYHLTGGSWADTRQSDRTRLNAVCMV